MKTQPDETTLGAICRHLSGQPVTVRRRKPVFRGCAGQAYLDDAGRFYVDLAPDLEGEALVRTLCHETAHILAGDTRPSRWAHAKSESIGNERVTLLQKQHLKN